MALKEVFQHSIALSDIDPELTGVTRKQVWDALKTAYLNRHCLLYTSDAADEL